MTDDLIAEIAEKHGVAIGRDDPILILHTLNERLAAENERRHEEQMRAFQAMLDAQAIEASRRLRAAIREESAAAHDRLSEASDRSRVYAVMALWAGVAALASSLIIMAALAAVVG